MVIKERGPTPQTGLQDRVHDSYEHSAVGNNEKECNGVDVVKDFLTCFQMNSGTATVRNGIHH